MVYCPNQNCSSGKDYDRIARHFSACGYPDIDDKHLSIIKGVLMGDATIGCDNSRNQKMTVYSTNKEFLQHLVDVLPEWLITTEKPQLFKSKKQAQASGEDFLSDRNYDYKSYSFSEQYRVRTIRHPVFNELRGWYSDKKELPKKENLNRNIIKYWFVCDGNTQTKGRNKYSKIASKIAGDEKLKEYGNKIETVAKVSVNVNTQNGIISMDSENTEKFLRFLGEPVNGFEYKW